MGESTDRVLRLDFDRRLKLEFHGSKNTSGAGLIAYRELDDALGLTDMVGDELVDLRTGKNGQHAVTGLLRQRVVGRLGGYEGRNAPSQCEMVKDPSFSSPNQPNQGRTTAYRAAQDRNRVRLPIVL